MSPLKLIHQRLRGVPVPSDVQPTRQRLRARQRARFPVIHRIRRHQPRQQSRRRAAQSMKRHVVQSIPRTIHHRQPIRSQDVKIFRRDGLRRVRRQRHPRPPLLHAQLSQTSQTRELASRAPLGVALLQVPHGERRRGKRRRRRPRAITVRLVLTLVVVIARGVSALAIPIHARAQRPTTASRPIRQHRAPTPSRASASSSGASASSSGASIPATARHARRAFDSRVVAAAGPVPSRPVPSSPLRALFHFSTPRAPYFHL